MKERYDQVPYGSRPSHRSHPDHIAVIAELFGMQPVPVTEARILEIGCAEGGNLLPIAAQLPNATVVGVDLSPNQIETGRRTIEALGLKNVTLHDLDICTIDRDFGTFDYIITHGVYSWVPDPVKEAVLRISKENLAEQGIAYISYNTYPGWYLRGCVRGMMCYHARNFEHPVEQVAQARALLDFLVESVPVTSPYGQMLRWEQKDLSDQSDEYVYHEHLSPVNDPQWFHQFISAAAQHGLQYVGEGNFSTMLPTQFEPGVAEVLANAGGLLDVEQYIDFVSHRHFRRTLLCHEGVELDRNVTSERLMHLRYSAYLKVKDEKKPSNLADPNTAATFLQIEEESRHLSTHDPVLKAALHHLAGIRPVSLSFAELSDAVASLLGSPMDEALQQRLADGLLMAFSKDFIGLHRITDTFVRTPGPLPEALPLARYLAAQGAGILPNLRQRSVIIDPMDQRLVPRLDGTRDHAHLVETLHKDVTRGDLELDERWKPMLGYREGIQALLTAELARKLEFYGRTALLVG